MKTTLILGGARSGKSTHAEALAAKDAKVLYVATARALDDDMARRIRRHREERPASWVTLEAPRGVGAALRASGFAGGTVLLECLTLLACNVLLARSGGPGADAGIDAAAAEAELSLELFELREAAKACGVRHLIIVSNEVGLGIVPDNALSRAYRDLLGRANQRTAAWADEVLLLVAGIPVVVKAAPAA